MSNIFGLNKRTFFNHKTSLGIIPNKIIVDSTDISELIAYGRPYTPPCCMSFIPRGFKLVQYPKLFQILNGLNPARVAF